MRRALRRAVEHRRQAEVRAQIGAATSVFRLVHGEADGVRDVVIDRYGDVVRVELYDEKLVDALPEIAEALREAGEGTRAIVALQRARQARDSQLFAVDGAAPAAHVVYEDGARYLVRVAEASAVGTGIFVDHREGRRLVRRHARGGIVLNLFAHAGAFGVAAIVGGAARVDHVDSARKSARWGAFNYSLNGTDPRRHRFLVDDAFKVLARAARRGATYDVVVCDPPTTAIDPKGKRFLARERLPELAEQGARALREGGLLILSINDRSVPARAVIEALVEGARHAGRDVTSVREVPMGPDLPASGDVRLRPMRGAALQLA